MPSRIEQISQRVFEVLGKRESFMDEKHQCIKENKQLEKDIRYGKAALHIATSLGDSLQTIMSERLSSIASYCLQAIFPNPYKVRVAFSSSGRGTIDAQVLFNRDGEDFRPVLPSGQFLSGGGPVEVAAFGLRCGLWAQVASSNTRPIFFFDEPFRFIQKDLQEAVCETLLALCEKIGIQIILVTHEPDIAANAHNTIQVKGEKTYGRNHLLHQSHDRDIEEDDPKPRNSRKRRT